jgi:hypothetical protein
MPVVKPVRNPDAGDPHVRFDEGAEETEPWNGYRGTPRGNGEQQLCRSYRHGASALLCATLTKYGFECTSADELAHSGSANPLLAPSEARAGHVSANTLRPDGYRT